MCRRPRVVLISLLVATMNVSAQDSAPSPNPPTPKEKESTHRTDRGSPCSVSRTAQD